MLKRDARRMFEEKLASLSTEALEALVETPGEIRIIIDAERM